MVFLHDRLSNGQKFCLLTIIDAFTRECLALEIAYGFKSMDVIATLRRAMSKRGKPRTLRCDNGSEFTSHAMLRWGAERLVQLHFIDPGKPTQNAQIESLTGRFKDVRRWIRCRSAQGRAYR
jgi:putative transposase